MEFIFEILFEFIIQIVVEVFIGATVHLVSAVFNRFSGPWLAALGCAAVGALLGGASLWMFPHRKRNGAYREFNRHPNRRGLVHVADWRMAGSPW